MNKHSFLYSMIFLLLFPGSLFASDSYLTITAENSLDVGRLSQTILLSKEQLKPLGDFAFNSIHVKDASGRDLICQPVDTTGDHFMDGIIFQADFAPNQTRTFKVYIGKRHLYTPDQYKAYGRFVRERFDDFAWENDRIAQRTYGMALKYWKGEPLTSSTIDLWPKSTNKLVINDWYLTDHYHINSGDGADMYSSGNTRGVGGDGLWKNNKLWTAENFVHSNVYSKGPIRISFTLDYNKYEVDENQVSEKRHIALDAGHNLNHFTVSYQPENNSDLVAGVGIQKTDMTKEEVRKNIDPMKQGQFIEHHPGDFVHKDINKEEGWITTEQPLTEGMLYAAIIVNPDKIVKFTKDDDNELVLVHVPKDHNLSYWAGYSWSRSGQFKNYEAWKKHISQVAQGVRNPIKVTISRNEE